MPLSHHERCFGCGPTNLFGLLLEVEQTRPGAVRGRCFIKQDHQGPDRLSAHEGVIAAALSDAMALACGGGATATRLTLQVKGQAPVGSFLEVDAVTIAGKPGMARARATVEGRPVATATGSYARS